MPSIYRCHLNFGVWLMQLNCQRCVVKHTSTTKVQQIQKKVAAILAEDPFGIVFICEDEFLVLF